MPTITALEAQTRRPRANLYLDGAFAFALSLESVAERDLQVGQTLSESECQALQREDLYRSAREAAWRLLSYRVRSRQELRQRLLRKGFSAETTDAVLTRLLELGHLDDTAFARSLVQQRSGGGGAHGPAALRGELRRRGIAREAAEQALTGLDESAAAREAAERRARSLSTADPALFRRRLGDFLVRRGFSYETARETVAALLRERRVEAEADDSAWC